MAQPIQSLQSGFVVLLLSCSQEDDVKSQPTLGQLLTISREFGAASQALLCVDLRNRQLVSILFNI